MDHRYSDWLHRLAAGELPRHVQAVEQHAVGVARRRTRRRTRPRTGRAAGTRPWRRPPARRARTPGRARTLASGRASPSGSSRPRETGLLASSSSSSCRTAPGSWPSRVVQQHVAAEVGVSGEDLVGALAGQHDLVAGVAHGPAQQVLRHAVRVEAERLGLPGRVGEVVGEVGLADRDRVELGPGVRRHLAGDGPLVVVGPVEGQREGPDRIAAGAPPPGPARRRSRSRR